MGKKEVYEELAKKNYDLESETGLKMEEEQKEGLKEEEKPD